MKKWFEEKKELLLIIISSVNLVLITLDSWVLLARLVEFGFITDGFIGGLVGFILMFGIPVLGADMTSRLIELEI